MSEYIAPQHAASKRHLAHRAKILVAISPLLLASLLLIPNAPASAAPSNNPNFATLDYVQNAINNAANIGLTPIQNAITALQQQQAAQATQISSLQGSVANLQSLEANEGALFSNLQNSIASLQTQQSNNTSQINILQTSVNTIQSQQTTTTSQVSNLQTQETSETSLLTNLQNQVASQATTITSLQNSTSKSLKVFDANNQELGLLVDHEHLGDDMIYSTVLSRFIRIAQSQPNNLPNGLDENTAAVYQSSNCTGTPYNPISPDSYASIANDILSFSPTTFYIFNNSETPTTISTNSQGNWNWSSNHLDCTPDIRTNIQAYELHTTSLPFSTPIAFPLQYKYQ